MRALFLVLCASGCSILYNGDDLKGKSAHRPMWTSANYTGADEGTSDLAAGDIDGDGKLDLVSVEVNATDILAYLGNGDGSFSAPVSSPVGCVGPAGVTLADLDKDGLADAVVVCFDGVNVSTGVRLMAMGGGTFADGIKFATGGMNPTAIESGDLNGDGNPDVVIANHDSGNVALLRGEGDGNLAMNQPYHTDNGAAFVAIGDLDGDGSSDVAVTNGEAGSVSVLLNSGGALSSPVSYTTEDVPRGVVIGDFDKKKGADLALTAVGDLDVTLNQGGGTFPAAIATATQLPVAGMRIRAADFDRDGKLDLVVGAYTQPSVMFLYGKGDGTFEKAVPLPTSTPGGLVVADFDGDGKPDVAVGGDGIPGNLTILLSR